MDQPWALRRNRQVSLDEINAARALAAATLYEANQKRGALDPNIRQMASELNVYGSALTVRCQAGDNLTLHAAVARVRPGDVIVADVGDFSDVGHWGEILTVAARSRQIAGLVINGGVRDIAMLAVHQFPVFARGISIDLIIGDADGVVAIPHDSVGDVIKLGREREAAEADMMD